MSTFLHAFLLGVVTYSNVFELLEVLDDESRGTTATVADTGDTNLGLSLRQDRGQGGDDTSTGAAQRVADGDRATVDVDLLGVKAKDLEVGKSDNGESLVDLVVVDVLLGEAGVLDGLGDGEGRSDGEALGLTLSVAPAENLGDGGQVELLELGLGDEDDGGATVVDGGGVGGGD